MSDAAGIVLLLLAVVAAVPAVVLFVQIAAAVVARSFATPWGEGSAASPRVAVLMPAHDEAAGIEMAIAAARAQLGPHDRLLVVADNCSDATAIVAAGAGAEVTERSDALLRGKGYALDHGVRHLERDPPNVVVIVDADCIVAPGALAHLAARCLGSGRPTQALYLMRAPAGAGLGLRIAEFAWRVRNHLRPLGSAALGGPCQLMGTGMAFPWPMIQRAALASGHLVEDMQLGLDLACAGTPPLYCPGARVDSLFPVDAAASRQQRTRWEHGHLSVLVGRGPRAVVQAIGRRDLALALMALDLMVPPLAALVLGLTTLLAVTAGWWWLVGDARSFVVAAAAMLLIALAVAAAWVREGRQIVSLREMAGLPLYVAAKIPMYVRLFTKRQVEWVRTKRDDRRS